jgi:hypothetical protein
MPSTAPPDPTTTSVNSEGDYVAEFGTPMVDAPGPAIWSVELRGEGGPMDMVASQVKVVLFPEVNVGGVIPSPPYEGFVNTVRACLGISGIKGNEWHWGGGISIINQNFSKSPQSSSIHLNPPFPKQTLRGTRVALPLHLPPDTCTPVKSMVSNFAQTVCRAPSPGVLQQTPPARRAHRQACLPPRLYGEASGSPRNHVFWPPGCCSLPAPPASILLLGYPISI